MKTPQTLLVLAGLASTTVLAMNMDPASDCHDNFVGAIVKCEQRFGPGTLPDFSNSNANPASNQACADGAEKQLSTCLNGANHDDLNAAWTEFMQNLRDCLAQQNPIQKQACIDGALILYSHRVSQATPNHNNGCGAQQLPSAGSPIESLKSATTPNGFITLATNTAMTVSAGISVNPNGSYDVGATPCLKNAIAIAVYATKTGTVSKVVSADADLSDGASFSYYALSSDLIDASNVTLIITYFDQDSVPVFVEYADLEIENSPISRD